MTARRSTDSLGVSHRLHPAFTRGRRSRDPTAGTIIIVSRGDTPPTVVHMTQRSESHVGEWASLLGERVAEESIESRDSDQWGELPDGSPSR